MTSQACPRLRQSWVEKGAGGTSGGTNAIESIDLTYSYSFKAGVTVKANSAGQPKECVMLFSQHLDASGGSDLGFYKASNTQTVLTSPPDEQVQFGNGLQFYGNVTAHITDPDILKSWYGSNSAVLVNVIDLAPSKTKDGLDCAWGAIEKTSADGSLTVNYRRKVLYAPAPTSKLPQKHPTWQPSKKLPYKSQ